MAPDQAARIRLFLTKVHCGFAVQDMRVQRLVSEFDSIQTCFVTAGVKRNGQAFGEFCNNTGAPNGCTGGRSGPAEQRYGRPLSGQAGV